MKGKKKASKKDAEVNTETPKTEAPEEVKGVQVDGTLQRKVEGLLPLVKFNENGSQQVERFVYANDRSLTVRLKSGKLKRVQYTKVITIASEATSMSLGS